MGGAVLFRPSAPTIATLLVLSVALLFAPGAWADEAHCIDPEDLCEDTCEWGWSCTDDCTNLCVLVDPPAGGDDELCDELLADESFDGIASCFLAKATVDFLAGTLLIEGTICDAPNVRYTGANRPHRTGEER